MSQNQNSPRRDAKRHRVRCWRERIASPDESIAHALLKVAICRYGMFVQKFGRDPRPNEPLFFDPHSDQPIQADTDELHRQVIETAGHARVNAEAVLKFLSLSSSESMVIETSPR